MIIMKSTGAGALYGISTTAHIFFVGDTLVHYLLSTVYGCK